ncbi:hypothetical protein Q7P37_010535 [Cladosporium fusiforme]
MSSTNNNIEAVANQMPTGGSGEFNPKPAGASRENHDGHKPGVLTGNDAVPEFNVKTLPPGSAPADKSFTSNVQETPAQASYNKPSASDSLGGFTSGDVHAGLGKPIQGQTSNEIHHDGQAGRKNPGMGGAEGVGGSASQTTIDPHAPEFAGQRALNNDNATIGRGNVGGPAAEDRLPESANTVAQENKLPRN